MRDIRGYNAALTEATQRRPAPPGLTPPRRASRSRADGDIGSTEPRRRGRAGPTDAPTQEPGGRQGRASRTAAPAAIRRPAAIRETAGRLGPHLRLPYMLVVVDELQRPDDGGCPGRGGIDLPDRPDGARGRDPLGHRHPAAVGRRDHRSDQGEHPVPARLLRSSSSPTAGSFSTSAGAERLVGRGDLLPADGVLFGVRAASRGPGCSEDEVRGGRRPCGAGRAGRVTSRGRRRASIRPCRQ